MNSYTDKDFDFLFGVITIVICILLICFVGKVIEQEEINNQIENRIKNLENIHQKS